MFRIKLLLCVLFFTSVLAAQDFEVAPVLMTFNGDPGEIQKKDINLINHSGKIQKYNLKVADYVLEKDGSKKTAPAGSTPHSCADWITINPSFVELNPNQSTTIQALMTVPKNGFSAKWCQIFVEATKEQTPFEVDKALASGVFLVPRIVILVKQTPKSNTNFKAGISGLKEVTKPGDTERNFEALVTNTGDNVIEASVSLALANIQTAKEEKFAAVKVTVYPDNSRIVKLHLPKTLTAGKYALAAILDYGHRQPLGGTQMMLEVK